MIRENKEKWGDKVRFVCLSLEGENDTKELLAKKNEWIENLEFYFFKDGRNNPSPKIYGVRYIPHLVIVGKDGIIRSVGHADNIQNTIQELLNEEGGYKEIG